MEIRNLEKALDIVSKLITGEAVSEKSANAPLYQEYNNNMQVYDIVHIALKKMNLEIYEYNNGLYVSSGENNQVFGYSNEELRKELGIKLNRELYLAYFIIYNTITQFYRQTEAVTYVEFTRVENVIKSVDDSISGIIDKRAGIILGEVEENSFKQIALSWEELPAATDTDRSGLRAARNSKAGFVKIVFNFLVSQDLLAENEDRYYPTDRFRALIENYFDDYKGRLAQLLADADRKKQEVD
ncbi:MAG: DUF6063 family protein [Lachnospira sp.]